MKLKLAILFLFIIQIQLTVSGQKKDIDLHNLLKSGKLSVVNRNATLLDDHKGIQIDEKNGNGMVWVDGVTLSRGTITLDIKGKDELQKSFVGIAFHGIDDGTYDAVYFRPFNFHAADSIRKIHSVQYISHPVYTWKKLRDEQNGLYEKALLQPPDPNKWFHARIIINDREITVFVNEDKTPSLTATKLTAIRTGKIGLWVGEGSGGSFANLTINPD